MVIAANVAGTVMVIYSVWHVVNAPLCFDKNASIQIFFKIGIIAVGIAERANLVPYAQLSEFAVLYL
jgi:hypothetical protein